MQCESDKEQRDKKKYLLICNIIDEYNKKKKRAIEEPSIISRIYGLKYDTDLLKAVKGCIGNTIYIGNKAYDVDKAVSQKVLYEKHKKFLTSEEKCTKCGGYGEITIKKVEPGIDYDGEPSYSLGHWLVYYDKCELCNGTGLRK